MEERLAYLGFSLFSGIGPISAKKLHNYVTSLSSAWELSGSEFKNAGISEKIAEQFVRFRDSFSLEHCLIQMEKSEIWFVAQCDQEYPPELFDLSDPPLVLFGKGDKELLAHHPKVGIVGTRKMTSYGAAVTKSFAQELCSTSCTIVSGLALGVDAAAHKATCDAGGRALAVLGCGISCCYPSTNGYLYNSILENDGVMISEYPFTTPPSKGSFPARNRIIAALSDALIVTEGQLNSGSLITAAKALALGRKVFAVPGPITSSQSQGPYKLVRDGALLATSATEVLSVLNVSTKRHQIVEQMSNEEQMVMNLLQNEALTLDQVVKQSFLSFSQVSVLLSQMEIKRWIKRSSIGTFLPY